MSAIVVITFFILVEYGPDIQSASVAKQGPDGCASCHTKLSEKVPESHSKVTLEEVKYCLVCHELEGPALAFDWVIHRNHYAQSPFAGTCWSCHQIDAGGNFRLMGAEGGREIKVTREKVEKMSTYFRSWATPKYLDQKHGQQSVTCELCHGTFFPEKTVPKERCFRCHGSYEQLAARNPIHYNAIWPHWTIGPAECSDCHKAHAESLLCSTCH
jgi:hypothetical protein